MEVIRSGAGLRSALAALGPATVGFVPTMGALHEGHLSLLAAARGRAHAVVLSIFVNPLQFGPGEDLAAYPRDEHRDLGLAEAAGVDIAFCPSVEEMYPEGRSTTVHVAGVGDGLEGESRPGHFDGVATVVAKLFGLVGPSIAFFGQKDAQQVAVIRRMVADLSLPVEIVVCPTVRDGSGLALSSRNAYLGPGERRTAGQLFKALSAGLEALEAGGTVEGATAAMVESLGSVDGLELDYVRVVDPDTFGPPRPGHPVLLAVAARVGRARLIDNLLYQP